MKLFLRGIEIVLVILAVGRGILAFIFRDAYDVAWIATCIAMACYFRMLAQDQESK